MSPRMTACGGCCHGDEWHNSAWGQQCVLHMLPLCCHTQEEEASCITSFKDKKHSVVLKVQMVCEAFNRLFWNGARTGPWTKASVSWRASNALTTPWVSLDCETLCEFPVSLWGRNVGFNSSLVLHLTMCDYCAIVIHLKHLSPRSVS